MLVSLKFHLWLSFCAFLGWWWWWCRHTHSNAFHYWWLPNLPWQPLPLVSSHTADSSVSQAPNSVCSKWHTSSPHHHWFSACCSSWWLTTHLGVQAMTSELLLDSFLSLTSQVLSILAPCSLDAGSSVSSSSSSSSSPPVSPTPDFLPLVNVHSSFQSQLWRSPPLGKLSWLLRSSHVMMSQTGFPSAVI